MLERIRPRVVAALAVAGVAAGACANLPTIETNQCGNRLVESSEDCDTFAPSGSVCRPAGTDGACHFDCTGANACPPTFSCGAVDKICRQSTGTFDVTGSQTLFAPANALAFGDYDGDGRADALTSGLNDLRIHYFDGRLSLSKTLILPLTSPKFKSGSIGNDTSTDLTILKPSGLIDIFRGLSDRTVAPVVYSSVPIPNTKVTARAILVRNQIGNVTGDSLERPTGDDVVAFGSGDKGAGIVFDLGGRTAASGAAASPANSVIALPDGTVDMVAGDVAVGGFIEGSVCDQFAIAFSGDDKVDVFTPCRPLPPNPPSASKPFEMNTVVDANDNPDGKYVPPTRVTLPFGVTAGATSGTNTAGAFALDANGDGHLDLLLAATVAGATKIYVAYGIGDGTFSSSTTLSPIDDAASEFAPIDTILTTGAKKNPVPLAIFDLNGDKIPDFVFANGIYFSEPTRYVAGPVAGAAWSSAVVADMNRDGIPDVAAANPNGAIDFFLGTGTASMSYVSYGLDGLPSSLVVGDFDGDLVNDLAFAVNGATSGDAGAASSEIEVQYGQGGAFPSQPVTLGSLSTVLQLASAPLTNAYTGVTAPTNANVSSMVALGTDSASEVFASILIGDPDRLITSGFALFASTTQRATAIRVNSGPFVTPNQNDLMVLARDASDPTKYAFWYLPSSGDATLDSTKLTVGPDLPTNFDWTSAGLALGPTSSGIASSVVLAPSTSGPVELFAIDPSTLTPGPAITLPCTYQSPGVLQLRDVDLDGDGHLDALVFCPDVSGKTILTLLWGDQAGAFDASRITQVPLPSDPVVSFSVYRDGPVIPRSVLMLTAGGVFVTTPGGADKRTFGPVTQDPTLPGGSFMNTADIDGDGVIDLAIVDGTKTQVRFFRGIPVNDSPSVP